MNTQIGRYYDVMQTKKTILLLQFQLLAYI
jgi:hypothetical protein